ncbi:MAG: AAA-like domain-containing protein, partial [Lachnospiraceae bacterium]|nr:AAA-like domain-containing protein [Lachnospiraceae bacterium]
MAKKIFNVAGRCCQDRHYMVELTGRLQEIRKMVDAGQYFIINRARQYGKTTILQALKEYLREDYLVISLDFQMLSYADFENEQSFTAAFSGELLEESGNIPDEIRDRLLEFTDRRVAHATLSVLFQCLTEWCRTSDRGIVLMIDEVDSAANNQVFVDFLAQFRGAYIRRDRTKTFQSVILAGV